MRLCLVTGIFPPDIGGPASSIPALGAALTNRGHEIDVVTLADDPQAPFQADYPFKVHRIARGQFKPARMIQTVRQISRIAKSKDALFLNGLVLEGVIAAKLAKKPTIVKVVGDLMWERAQHAGRTENLDAFQTASLPVFWRNLRRLQSAYMKRANRIVTPSKYLARIVQGWGVPPDRIRVIYNAVPASHGHGGGVDSSQEFDVVTVGRLVPWKGVDALIDVCTANDWSLLIVGSGPLEAELKARAAKSRTRIVFTGHVPQVQVSAQIRRARVFVLNSSYEGLPHIVLEAKTTGVPVVATNAGGTGEVIADGADGLLVAVGDSAALTGAIGRLLADPRLRDTISGTARRQLLNFSDTAMFDQTESTIQDVVSGYAP